MTINSVTVFKYLIFLTNLTRFICLCWLEENTCLTIIFSFYNFMACWITLPQIDLRRVLGMVKLTYLSYSQFKACRSNDWSCRLTGRHWIYVLYPLHIWESNYTLNIIICLTCHNIMIIQCPINWQTVQVQGMFTAYASAIVGSHIFYDANSAP